ARPRRPGGGGRRGAARGGRRLPRADPRRRLDRRPLRPAEPGMTDRFEGKVVVISGAARGQGEAEARAFAAEGARVVLTDVLDVEGEQVAEEIGDAARYRRLDVVDEASWRE